MTRLVEAATKGEKEKVKEFIQVGDNINEKDEVYNCHYHLFLTYIFVTSTNMSICTFLCVWLYIMIFSFFICFPSSFFLLPSSFFLPSFLPSFLPTSFLFSFFSHLFLSFFLSFLTCLCDHGCYLMYCHLVWFIYHLLL